MKYIKKPLVVEAFQWGVEEEPDWFTFNVHTKIGLFPYCAIISTLEGIMEAQEGDMIIKGIQGEIYPCKKDIFDATYDIYEEQEE